MPQPQFLIPLSRRSVSSIYLTPVLGVTFPFNLIVGIPLFHAFARWWYA